MTNQPPKDDLLRKQLQDKAAAIQARLMGDPTKQELEAMQLHLSTLAQADRLRLMMPETHNHDHMDDHDHAAL
jgi:hypothetical protein